MLYKNYEIIIIKRQDCWVAYIDECFTYFEKLRRIMIVRDISPKEVLKLAKMEIELEVIKELKRKIDKSVAEIMKLDKRNNSNKQI